MGKLLKLIEELRDEEDAINWGWGYEAIEAIKEHIEEASKDFPMLDCEYNAQKDTCVKFPKGILSNGNCTDCKYDLTSKREEWFKEWLE